MTKNNFSDLSSFIKKRAFKKRCFSFLDEKKLFKGAPLTIKILASVLALIVATTSIVTIAKANSSLLEVIPTKGGNIKEGIVGTPRFINPILAVTSADKDLTALIYAGLTRVNSEGEIEPVLAKSYKVSEDGRIVTFTLKENASFHDGTRVTAEDVVFTVKKVQDGTLKSPKEGNWSGVSVSALDEQTVEFVLEETFSPFLYNTTLGILPSHIWKDIDTQQFSFTTHNIEPIGAGPYMIKNIKKDGDGIPKTYQLVPFDDYVLGPPYIENIIINTYPTNEDLFEAVQERKVGQAVNLSQEKVVELNERRILSSALPRVFGIFLNQNEADIFTDISVRLALYRATDRESLTSKVFGEYATPITGAVPPILNVNTLKSTTTPDKSGDVELARKILEENNWLAGEDGIRTKDENLLSFTLATANTPDLKRVAEEIKRQWQEIGVSVNLAFYDQTDLKQSVIRPRDFDALLFGQVINPSGDLYPFWHSSQRVDPGLNVSQYANIDVDSFLEDFRTSFISEEKANILGQIEAEIKKDIPGVFLYSPKIIYLVSKDLKNINFKNISESQDRFRDVHKWYTKTDRVWPIFKN